MFYIILGGLRPALVIHACEWEALGLDLRLPKLLQALLVIEVVALQEVDVLHLERVRANFAIEHVRDFRSETEVLSAHVNISIFFFYYVLLYWHHHQKIVLTILALSVDRLRRIVEVANLNLYCEVLFLVGAVVDLVLLRFARGRLECVELCIRNEELYYFTVKYLDFRRGLRLFDLLEFAVVVGGHVSANKDAVPLHKVGRAFCAEHIVIRNEF